ncbi:MAG: hypothetical protein ACI82Z_000154 [Cellvibrionaceae bacterium]|jgi:hypothetical protein
MVRRLRIYIYLLIILFPVATYLLAIVNESNGLIWLALDTGYYYPIYIIVAPLFERLEMGLLMPSIGGRCLALVLYPLLLFLFFKMKGKMLP